MTRARRGFAHGALLWALLVAAGGLVTAVGLSQLGAPPAPPIGEPAIWLAGLIAGAAGVLYVIKELRYLLKGPPVRQIDQNVIAQVSELDQTVGEMRSDYAALAQILKNLGEELGRLRNSHDGLDDRISAAMSRVASQANATIGGIQGRLEERQEKFETRLLALERGRRR